MKAFGKLSPYLMTTTLHRLLGDRPLAYLSLLLIIATPVKGEAKTIVWVDAYHPELEWSAEILKGIRSTLDPKLKTEELRLEVLYLDTKNNPGAAFAQEAAAKAAVRIRNHSPDLIIAGDDATAKFVIQRYFMKPEIPVVFCGINFDADQYGFGPQHGTSHITGIIEVPPVDIAIRAARNYGNGQRFGYLTFDDLSEKGNFKGIVNEFNIQIPESNIAFVSTMAQWKQAYLNLHSRVDFLIMGSANFMQGWDWAVARQFIIDHTRPGQALPITYNHWTIDIALLAYSKRGREQGQWAAQAALEILFENRSPSDIPFARNQEGDLLLNQSLADRLNITFTQQHRDRGQLIDAPINE